MTQEKKEERGADSQGHGEGLPRASAAACPAGGRSTGEDGGWRHLQQEEPSKADVEIALLGGGVESGAEQLLLFSALAESTGIGNLLEMCALVWASHTVGSVTPRDSHVSR